MNLAHTQTTFTIQHSTLADLFALHTLQQICFPEDAWGYFELGLMYLTPSMVRLKALHGNQLVGFVAGERNYWERVGWIVTICVHPQYQRQGIATALLTQCEAKLPEQRMRLTVRASNRSALKLYSELGYRKVNTWERYYTGGEDGVVMEKELGIRSQKPA